MLGHFLRILGVAVWGSGMLMAQSIHVPGALRGLSLSYQGQSLADKPFQDEQGKQVSVKGLKRLTLLKIWGTFCGPCVAEIPSLQTLRQTFSERELAIVPICIDNPHPQQVRAFLDQRGGSALPVFTDPGMGFVNTLNIQGVPVSILVDEEGKELWRKVGGPTSWADEGVIQHFKDLLKG